MRDENAERPCQGRGMNGWTPSEVFRKGIPKSGTDKSKKTRKAA